MNDRFKFRVWDKENKQFRDDVALGCNGKPFVITCDPKKPIEYLDNVEVNFCTGLKDRNKKLIYENDIIKNRKTGVYYQIIWNDEATAFMTKSKKNIISIYALFTDYPYSIEIIGNIYTTPELLEEQCK